jgi:hypothetical protein
VDRSEHADLREGGGKRQLRRRRGAAQHCRQQAAAPSVIATAAWRKASDAPSRNRRYCLPRLKNRSTALRARKGWRANSLRSNAESVAEHESEALRCPRKDSAGDRPHCPLAPWGARRPAALVAQRRVSRSAVRSFIVLALVRSCFI